MSLDFGTTQGAIFPALGKMGAVIANLDAHLDTQYTAMSSQTTGAVGQLANEPDVQAIIGGGFLAALGSIGSGVGPLMQQAAANYMARLVYRDNPRQGQTLTSFDTLSVIQEVIRQMGLQAATVRAHTLTITPGTFSNPSGGGNGVLVGSVKRPFDGRVLENAFAETLNVYVTTDSFVGGASEGNEGLQIVGGSQEPDPFAFDWPLGSGSSTGINAVDGSVSNGTGNLLTNSGWENWTTGLPDNWVVAGGATGVDFQQNTGITYDGLSSLQLLGGTMALVDFRQTFGDSSAGSADSLVPLAQYALNLWMRRGGTAVTGNLTFTLEDDSGVVINDAAGVANSAAFNLASLTTSWQSFTAVFRTPLVLPDSYRIRFRPSANNSLGDSVYIDRMALAPMNQLYVSGPYVASFSGSVPFRIGDVAQIVVTNSRGSGGTLTTWQTLLSRLFFDTIYTNEIIFPSSGAPSVGDNLIA